MLENQTNKGQKIAFAGIASEILITDAINYFIKEKEFPSVEILSAYENLYTLGEDELKMVFHDSIHSANILFHHVHTNYGPVHEAHHTGSEVNTGVEKLTGKKSSADIVLQLQEDMLGLSLKYTTSSRKPSQIKIHSPTPITLFSIIEKSYIELFGKPFGLQEKFNQLQFEAEQSAKIVFTKHHDFLIEVFGEGESRYRTTKGPTIYKPDNTKGPVLNNGALSYIRRMSESGNTQAKEFYKELTSSANIIKRLISNHCHQAVFEILTHPSNHSKVISNTLFLELVNAPPKGSTDHLETILIDINRQKDDIPPKINIYHTGETIWNYLDKSDGTHIIKNSINSTTFRVGPTCLEVDLRPGSKSGCVNVRLDKKALHKIGEY